MEINFPRMLEISTAVYRYNQSEQKNDHAVTEQVIVVERFFSTVIKRTGSTITEEEIRKLYTKRFQ